MDSTDHTTRIRLFKDRSSPNAYKEFACVVSTPEREYRGTVPALEIQALLQNLTAAQISPFVPGNLGLGGITFELEIEEDSSRAAYRWWSTPGEGRQALSSAAAQLIQVGARVSGLYLP